MIGQIAGERRADRGADTDRRAHDALRQVESAGAARDIGDHQRHHHTERRGRDAIEDLHGDQQIRIGHQREQQRAEHQRGEGQSQERKAAPNLGMVPDPGRDDGDDDLRYHDARGDQHRRPFARAHRHHAAHQRQHRGIGHVEQQGAARQDQQRRLANDDAHVHRRMIGLLRHRPAMRSVWIDLGRPDLAQGDQGWNEQHGSDEEIPPAARRNIRRRPSPPPPSHCRSRQIGHCAPAARQSPRGRQGRGSSPQCTGQARSLRAHAGRRPRARAEKSAQTRRSTPLAAMR